MSATYTQVCTCCDSAPCLSCCWQITFTGVTWNTDPVVHFEQPYYVTIEETQGTLNTSHIICDSPQYIRFAAKTVIRSTVDDSYLGEECGYAELYCTLLTSPDRLEVGLKFPENASTVSFNTIFYAEILLTPEQVAILAGSDGCEGEFAFGTVSGDNEADADSGFINGMFANESGSVSVTLVPVCDGDTSFRPSCATEGDDFEQTICAVPDCPCGYDDEQVLCYQVPLKDTSGATGVYEYGTLISGVVTSRNYRFFGPFQRTDGSSYRFLVVRNNSSGIATMGQAGMYFELECVGLTTVIGTFTQINTSDWIGGNANVAGATSLTGMSTSITVTGCPWESALDVYTLSVQCTVGTNPSGWPGNISLVRDSDVDPTSWTGTLGTYTATMGVLDDDWTLEIYDGATLKLSATISGTGDPIGTHTPSSSVWSGSCATLRAIIS